MSDPVSVAKARLGVLDSSTCQLRQASGFEKLNVCFETVAGLGNAAERYITVIQLDMAMSNSVKVTLDWLTSRKT